MMLKIFEILFYASGFLAFAKYLNAPGWQLALLIVIVYIGVMLKRESPNRRYELEENQDET